MTQNTNPNPTPRQMEFTIQLPDRETQYQKTPATITVQKQVTLTSQTSTVMPDGTEIDDDPVTGDPIVNNVEVPLTQPATQTNSDGSTVTIQQPMTYGDLLDAVQDEQSVSDPSTLTVAQLKTNVATNKANVASEAAASKTSSVNTMLPVQTTVLQSMSANLTSIAEINDLDDVETAVKQLGEWGCGCPYGDYFWTLGYENMIPQILVCPVCGAKITLTVPSS